jgi:hypothetical protein
VRRRHTLLLMGALVLVTAVWVPALVLSMRDPHPPMFPAPSAGEAAWGTTGVVAERPRATGDTPAFASAGEVVLQLPARRVRGVAFHEAALPGAKAMRPVGRCAPCRHHRFAPRPADGSGLRFIVLPPRGRGSSPTSAVDVVVGARTTLFSPVTGTVRAVEPYRLYGRHRDVRVVLRPDGAPGTHVILIHLRGVRLSEGDRVEASVTPLGWARGFPFGSQVDRYVRGGLPHVHIEVVDARARRKA